MAEQALPQPLPRFLLQPSCQIFRNSGGNMNVWIYLLTTINLPCHMCKWMHFSTRRQIIIVRQMRHTSLPLFTQQNNSRDRYSRSKHSQESTWQKIENMLAELVWRTTYDTSLASSSPLFIRHNLNRIHTNWICWRTIWKERETHGVDFHLSYNSWLI